MISIVGKNITLTRGDYALITMALNSGGAPYVLGENDTLLFSVKRRTSNNVTIEKRIRANETNSFGIEILPSDTRDLPEGDYVWDIRIFPESGKVHTPMEKAFFRIVKAVGNDE